MWWVARLRISVNSVWAISSVIVPSGRPGATRLRFSPSIGETNPERAANIGRLATGTAITVPVRAVGSSWRVSSRTAVCPGYSVA
jgi:hypothetical protein